MFPFITSNILIIFIASGFLIISLSLMAVAVRDALMYNQKITRRLVGAEQFNASNLEHRRSKKNILTQLGSHLTLPKTEEITRLRFQLSQAGFYNSNAVKNFVALRVICLFGPQFVVIASWGFLYVKISFEGAVGVAAGLAILGLLGPIYFIKWRKNKRTNQCRNGFPDLMDLLVACIEAGLGLDAALARVGDELGERYPALKINLDIMNMELRAGRLRHEAMINFANRIDLKEAKALAIMLKQAEEMGSSLGATLRTFSDEMRMKRMLRAEEKAMALSAKLTVPLILFIFPTITVLLLVPAGIRLMGALG